MSTYKPKAIDRYGAQAAFTNSVPITDPAALLRQTARDIQNTFNKADTAGEPYNLLRNPGIKPYRVSAQKHDVSCG